MFLMKYLNHAWVCDGCDKYFGQNEAIFFDYFDPQFEPKPSHSVVNAYCPKCTKRLKILEELEK